MLLRRLVTPALFASLALACSSHLSPPPRAAVAPAPAQAEPAYVTIQPDVSVSETARETELKSAALDPGADVMAEILAIPPGR
jgi:hypothetical protein